jgi:hypothetical protein
LVELFVLKRDYLFASEGTPVKMPDLHSLPEGSRPDQAVRNNGSENLALERFKLRELAEGWPLYR